VESADWRSCFVARQESWPTTAAAQRQPSSLAWLPCTGRSLAAYLRGFAADPAWRSGTRYNCARRGLRPVRRHNASRWRSPAIRLTWAERSPRIRPCAFLFLVDRHPLHRRAARAVIARRRLAPRLNARARRTLRQRQNGLISSRSCGRRRCIAPRASRPRPRVKSSYWCFPTAAACLITAARNAGPRRARERRSRPQTFASFAKSLSTNGHLLRWRCASAPHVPITYAPVRFSRRLASDTFLNRRRFRG
jgi:hypothetical protein